VENVLGRVPLIPCFRNGYISSTIPHCSWGKIPKEAAADSRLESWIGSRLFEINMWMWRNGSTFESPFLDLEQDEAMSKKRVQESMA
jgi:hypothetical protein